ncbi:MAG TPA: nucleotidyltransferase family protein, partial [Nitrosopumilaceae archaeon]|nr:nucleotidyltransferase family protein [Nitrosopumilaceae archaeon]
MQAVILAGGRGKRLKPITDYVPKPLVPLNNVPILEWQIRYLKKFGIKEFIICTGYKTDQIENFLKAKNNLGVKIQYSVEKTPLGTGGAIKKIISLIKDKSFLVINGDVITNIDIKKLKLKINSIAAIPLKTK